MADPAQKRDTLTEDGQHSEDAGDSQLPTDNGSSSDDDDWFNKSLDDFEIPAATVKSDRWDNEDEDEPEEEGPQRPDTGRGTSARSGSASARTAGASKPDKQEQKQENGLNGGSRISDAAGQAEDDSSPEKRTPSPGEEAGGDEGQRPEEEKGTKIPGIRRIFGPILVLKPTSRPGREPAGEDGAWAPVKEEESAEEAEVPEERDEEWFLRNLKELPTMFNLIRVHSMPTARYDLSHDSLGLCVCALIGLSVFRALYFSDSVCLCFCHPFKSNAAKLYTSGIRVYKKGESARFAVY